MLLVSASRHGLLLSVWAKPTLYLSFLASGGSAAKAREPRVRAATPTAEPTNNFRRVMIMRFPPRFSRFDDVEYSSWTASFMISANGTVADGGLGQLPCRRRPPLGQYARLQNEIGAAVAQHHGGCSGVAGIDVRAG